MENALKSNLKMLKELILDENKLVTYISLSKELCIHVNEAKSLLNHIVQDIRKMEPKTEIHICYIISGLLSNNSGCTTVCPESEIEKLRQTLNIVFYEHVYCVSKGMQDVDIAALTAINKFDDFSLCTGLIKANSCSKRSDSEICNLKCSNSIAIESKSSNVISKITSDKKKEQIKNGHENIKKTVEVKSEPAIKSKTPSPKKEATSIKTSHNKNGTKPAAKSIAGFFSKANGDGNKAKNAKAKEEKCNNKIEIKVEKEIKAEAVDTNKNISVKTENNKPIKSNKIAKIEEPMDEPIKSNKIAKIEEPVKNSLKQIKKNAKVDKKRKRLLRVSDSESDTEANDPFGDDDNMPMSVDNESEDEIPPTPTVNTVKITSGMINPKKRRKIVDKTYTDDDGYILTKKEEVYESCSDHEEEIKVVSTKQEKENVQVTQVKVETSPKEKGKSKKKVSPPQKGKQQTLTSFFKKV